MVDYKIKYLKYKKKYTLLKNGGSLISIDDSLFSLYPNCLRILKGLYTNGINYKTYTRDPFFDDFNKPEFDLLVWYKKYNPKFKPMKINESIMEEYLPTIAGIIKDYYILLLTSKFSSGKDIDLRDKSILLLNITSIEDAVKNNLRNFKYYNIFNIIHSYVSLFEKNLNDNNKNCDDLLIFENSPYIIYPSFFQINFYKINLTIGVPFINFLLSNHEHLSHDFYAGTCWEVSHDIMMHYYNVNIKIFYYLYSYKITKDEPNIGIINLINNNPDTFKAYFEYTNNIIQKIKSSFIYSNNIWRKTDTFIQLKNKQDFNKYMKAIIIFYLFHEVYFYKYLLSVKAGKQIPDIFNYYYNNFFDNSLSLTFKEDFRKTNIFTQLLKDTTNFKINFSFIKEDLYELIIGSLNIKSNYTSFNYSKIENINNESDFILFIESYITNLKELHDIINK
jgi:hypothetical protein